MCRSKQVRVAVLLRVYKLQSAEEGSGMQADPLIHVMLSDLQLRK